jgi:endonuclease-3 related protein
MIQSNHSLHRKNDFRLLLTIYKILYNSFGPQNWWPGDSPFEIMIGAILTQNTNWRNVSKAIDNIKGARLLEPKRLLKHRRMIPRLIRPSGFYKLKSQRLIGFLNYYVKTYQGFIKKMDRQKTEILRRELLQITGIGNETADAILLYALSRPVFVVDAYTRRIFSRHNIFHYHMRYDEIRSFFEKHLPHNVHLYNEYHALLVKLGKEYCKKTKPLCDVCPMRNIRARISGKQSIKLNKTSSLK